MASVAKRPRVLVNRLGVVVGVEVVASEVKQRRLQEPVFESLLSKDPVHYFRVVLPGVADGFRVSDLPARQEESGLVCAAQPPVLHQHVQCTKNSLHSVPRARG